MGSKFENRVWLSVEIDKASERLYDINKALAIACMIMCVLVGVGCKDYYGPSVYMLVCIPFLALHIFVWKLIRMLCVAVSLMLADSCKDNGEEEEE